MRRSLQFRSLGAVLLRCRSKVPSIANVNMFATTGRDVTGTEYSVSIVSAAAAIAQLGERQTEDLKVPGSIPGFGKIKKIFFGF